MYIASYKIGGNDMNEYRKLSKSERIEFWKNHIQAWKESELLQKQYCKENSISVRSFQKWNAKLKNQTNNNKFMTHLHK